MTKLLTIYFDGGVFKTMDGSQKCFRPKMMALTTSITMQISWKSHVGARGRNVIFFTFLKITLVGRRPLWCVVELLLQDIASAFVDRFRRCLQHFFRKKSPFQPIEQFSKLSLGGATIGAPMREKIVKIWENGWKVCAHHFDHPEVTWKKNSNTALYPIYCRCAPV